MLHPETTLIIFVTATPSLVLFLSVITLSLFILYECRLSSKNLVVNMVGVVAGSKRLTACPTLHLEYECQASGGIIFV